MTLKSVLFGLGFEIRHISPGRRARLLGLKKFQRGDTFMCSFPRSGNTWTRMIIACLLKPEIEEVDLDTIDILVPDLGKETQAQPSPRVFKNHAPDFSLYPKVIYNYRDGRDCLVSAYDYTKNALGYEGSREKFITDRPAQIYGFWHEHIRNALQYQRNYPDRILMLKYEKLSNQPIAEIESIASFLNISVDRKRIEKIIELTKIDRQKKIRKYDDPRKSATLGKGVVDRWRSTLSPEEVARFEGMAARELRALGYETS